MSLIYFFDFYYSIYKDAPDLMVPMMWFRQLAGVNAELAKKARFALSLKDIGSYVLFGLGGIGVGLIFIGISCIILRVWDQDYEDSEYDELLSNESESAVERSFDSRQS